MAQLFSKEAKAQLKAMNDTFKPGRLLDQGWPDALKAVFGLDGP